jgi:hypothetical protein
MKTSQTPTQSFVIAFILLAASALPAAAGVNRWTTSGPAAGVSCVAIDPTDPAVVYAGTLERGVLKSRDGGLSWSDPSDGKLDGVHIHSLAIDPLTPSSVYAGTSSDVFKSSDGGASWSDSLIAGRIYNLIFGSQKSTIYAADFDDESYYPGPSSVYKSPDAGGTWSRIASALSINPGTLVADPTRPSTLYAGDYEGGVYKSVDGGSTWRGGLLGNYVSALAIDPRDPATLYAGTYFGIFKSVDADLTWRLASTDLNEYGVNALAINPRNPSTLYAGTYRGVFRSTDGGATWSAFNTGLASLDIVTLALDRTGTRLHAGSRSSGVFDYQIPSGALDLSVGSDSQSRLLFADPDGRLVIRTIDRSGNSFIGTPYGPYIGWQSRAVADGSDGLTRVLWTNDDGSAALWLLGPEGNHASYRLSPAAGWTAVDVAASTPGTTHILWTDADGRIALWSVANAGAISTGPAYGPYPGWTAAAIADGQDGLTRVLWNRADGSAALALFGAAGLVASHPFGPVAGWRAVDIAVGADGQTRILWTHQDGRMALWRVNGDGNPTALGPIYPPPPGFTASRIAAGPDGLTRVLWSDVNGNAILWTMSADNIFQESFIQEDSIAGAWAGKFDSADPVDCDGDTPAQASFTRDGENVVGILRATENVCGFASVTFQGTLKGDKLVGTISGDRFRNGSSASGALSGTTLELTVSNSSGFIPGGRMHLHR